MCLAIPGKVLETFEENGLVMGLIDYAGTRNQACLTYTPEAGVGNYVIVHAGFAHDVLHARREFARPASGSVDDQRFAHQHRLDHGYSNPERQAPSCNQ